MVKRLLPLILVLLLALPAAAGEIRLSAAASLTDAVNALCAGYARAHPGTSCLPNFGASGTLAKQIAAGAPADLFVSANQQWVDFLLGEKRLAPGTVQTLAGNRLVFAGPKGRATSLADLPRLQRIAIGSPRSVPAGQYAEEALKKAGVYEQLSAAGKLVLAQDARQALVYADRGEVDGAFVYATDARLAQQAVVLFEVAPELHSPITYPMGLTTVGARNPEAVEFFRYLQSDEAKKILEKYGFAVR